MTPTKEQQAQEYAEKKFPELLLTMEKEPWPKTREMLAKAYSDGYTACEQSMTDSEAIVIQGWVARDECGFLAIYKRKPERELNPYVNRPSVWNGEVITTLNEDSFLSLTWSDEPIEVELTIKLKKR